MGNGTLEYINNNLQSDEQILFIGKVHWYVYVPAVLFVVIGLIFFSIYYLRVFGIIIFILAAFKFIEAWIFKAYTELAITNKRTIAKVGFIKRTVMELNNNKVESINFTQSVFGRIFDFGTIIIHGTGGGKNIIPSISHPIQFKNMATQIIDSCVSKQSNLNAHDSLSPP